MILNLLSFIIFFYIFLLINANEQFHFGIINHHTQWHVHCPQNNTKMLTPPSNDQPLISYECPHPSSTIEILPIELDLTFLCRLQSRLIWIIIDLYQYNTFLSLINSKDMEIKIKLNNQIEINDYKSEINNYINRFIMINAFYIPFESIDILLNKQIEIDIEIKNLNLLNQCQFSIKENSLWKTFIDNDCDSTQSKTLFIQHAQCDFYSTKLNPPVRISDDILLTTPTNNIPDFNVVLSIDEKQVTNQFDSTQNLTSTPTTNLVSYHHHYFLLEENYRQILASLARSTTNSTLLKLALIFLVIILIVLILFFLYMLCYHYYSRSRSSSLIRRSSLSI